MFPTILPKMVLFSSNWICLILCVSVVSSSPYRLKIRRLKRQTRFDGGSVPNDFITASNASKNPSQRILSFFGNPPSNTSPNTPSQFPLAGNQGGNLNSNTLSQFPGAGNQGRNLNSSTLSQFPVAGNQGGNLNSNRPSNNAGSEGELFAGSVNNAGSSGSEIGSEPDQQNNPMRDKSKFITDSGFASNSDTIGWSSQQLLKHLPSGVFPTSD